jgi:hypothetical protein
VNQERVIIMDLLVGALRNVACARVGKSLSQTLTVLNLVSIVTREIYLLMVSGIRRTICTVGQRLVKRAELHMAKHHTTALIVIFVQRGKYLILVRHVQNVQLVISTGKKVLKEELACT